MAALLFGTGLPLTGQVGNSPVLPERPPERVGLPAVGPRDLPPETGRPPEEATWWRGLWGVPEPDRLHGGLLAVHLRRVEDGISFHPMIGGSWRGFAMTVFENTHRGVSSAVGVGRSMVVVEGRDGGVRLGYRLAILAGYDEQLMGLAARWPVIPAGQLVADAHFRGVGVQLSWAWVVFALNGFVPLGR